MLPLCPECGQRLENSLRWLQPLSWLWHTIKLPQSPQTKANLQPLYRLSECASAVELQFLYPAVSESGFKTLCYPCHGQQIKHTVTPVAVQLRVCRNIALSWSVSTGTDVMQPVMVSTVWCCTHGHLLSVLWAKEKKSGKIGLHQKNFESVSRWNRDIYPNFYGSVHYQRLGEYQTVICKNTMVNYALEAFNNIIYTQNILNS